MLKRENTRKFLLFKNNKDSSIHLNMVVQLAEALRNKPEERGLDSRWCHWNFSLT